MGNCFPMFSLQERGKKKKENRKKQTNNNQKKILSFYVSFLVLKAASVVESSTQVRKSQNDGHQCNLLMQPLPAYSLGCNT